MDSGVTPGEGVVGREHRLDVRAGEVDRARVARGRVTEGVEGGDGDIVRHPSRGRAGKAADTERRREAAFTVIPLWVPVMDPVTVSVAVIERVPTVLRVTEKTWTPASEPLNV